jgi:hypothetical protein
LREAHDVREQRTFRILRHLVGGLDDGLRGRVAPGDLDQLRLIQELVGELFDLVGKRGREQEVLAFRRWRQQFHDALDVGNETHIEHAIRLVENENLDLAEIDALVLHVIEEPAGCRNQDFDAGAHDCQLRLDVDAAENAGRAKARVLAVFLDRLFDLYRELARRREDQRTDGVARGRGAVIRLRREPLENRQSKAGSLAGTGLGAAHDIAAGEDERNGLLLDRGGCGVAGLGDGTQQLRPQAELFECAQKDSCDAAHRVSGFRSRQRMRVTWMNRDGRKSLARPVHVCAAVTGSGRLREHYSVS